jgi:hypothetical protein
VSTQSWFAEATVAAPARTRSRAEPKSKPKPKAQARTKRRARSHGAILWIAVSAVLLSGVVFVNLGVLRLNLAVDRATQSRDKLRAQNAALQSQLSAALASPRIQAQAHKTDGLVPADPSSIGYVNLAP